MRWRGEHLPKIYDPLAVINRNVTSPLSYLEAEEILRRRFTAFCGDILARDGSTPAPSSARDVLGSVEADTYLGRIIEMVKTRGEELVDEFVAQFGGLVSYETVAELCRWVLVEFEPTMTAAHVSWKDDLRFRQVLKKRIKTIDGNYEVLPPEGRGGERYRFRLGANRWLLDTQVDLHGTRPDFVLLPGNPELPKIAIYIDSLEYHATPRHNRLADDSRKRARLRANGVIPWAITDADITLFSEGTGTSRAVEDINEDRMRVVVSKFSPDTQILEAVPRGSMELLWQWINYPDVNAWQKIARILPIAMLSEHPRGTLSLSGVDNDLTERLFAHGDGTYLWWDFSKGSFNGVTMAEKHTIATDPHLRTLLLIDDSTDNLERPSFADEWRTWLAWSNLTVFAEPMAGTGAVAATTSSLESIVEDIFALGIERKRAKPEAEPPGIWSEIFDDLEGDEGSELARTLMDAGAAEPEFGEEIHGVMALFSWPDRKVVVVYEPDDAIALGAAGWTGYTIDADGAELDELTEKVTE